MNPARLGLALVIGASQALPVLAWAEATQAPAATPEPAVEQRTALGERSREQEQILQRQLPGSEQRQLQAGQESFLALWLPALNDSPHGTVILVAGYGQHADHPTVIAPLRNKLPAAGWNSLSIGLPDALDAAVRPSGAELPADPAPPASPGDAEADADADADADAENPASEPDAQPERVPVEQSQMGHPANATEAAPEAPLAANQENSQQAHVERIFARIDAAVVFAQSEHSSEIVLAGNGTGAYWVARYATERQPAAVQRLALISIRAPSARTLAQEPAALPAIPTGDFFYRNRSDEQTAANQRRLASQRLKRKDYHAVGLQALPADPEAEREQLFRRLRGWLTPLPDWSER